MYKYCSTEESAHRQRQLEQCLLELMEDFPYASITVGQICELVGISRKSFYRYFDSKDGCLFGLIDHTLLDYEGFNLVYLSSGKRTLRRELEQFFLFWQGNKELLDVLRSSGLSGMLIERAIGFALSDTVMPRRFLPEDPEIMQKHVTTFGVCGLLSMVLSWHEEGFVESATDLSLIATRLLSKPLFPGAEHLL